MLVEEQRLGPGGRSTGREWVGQFVALGERFGLFCVVRVRLRFGGVLGSRFGWLVNRERVGVRIIVCKRIGLLRR